MGEASIILPTIEEQTEIVKHIESALLEIDAAIDLQQRNIDLINEYRTRLIADVVTGKVDVRGLVFALPEDFEDEEETETPIEDDIEASYEDDEFE